MNEEADSGFDMDGAVDSISDDLFGEQDNDSPDELLADDDVTLDDDTDNGDDSGEETELKASDEEEDNSEKPDEEELKAATQSWKKEMHESWGKLDKDTQDYIEQREAQMKEGLEQDRNDSNLGRSIRDVMSPYSNVLEQSGVDESTMVKNLLGAHWRLSTAPQEERVQLMEQLAQNYGVSLNTVRAEGSQNIDPMITQLQNELNGLKSELNTNKQESLQASREKVSKEVNEFAEKNEHFDEVSEQLMAFINAGETLESAYEKAVWANPVTRQKEIDRIAKEAEDTKKSKLQDKARKAKKAKSTNVKNRDTAKSPTGLIGTMEDTMRETLREIQNRTH